VEKIKMELKSEKECTLREDNTVFDNISLSSS